MDASGEESGHRCCPHSPYPAAGPAREARVELPRLSGLSQSPILQKDKHSHVYDLIEVGKTGRMPMSSTLRSVTMSMS